MSQTGSVYEKIEADHEVSIKIEKGCAIIILVDYKNRKQYSHGIPIEEAASTAEAILHYCGKQGIR